MRAWGGLIAALALAGCAPAPATLPTQPVPAGPAIAVTAAPVPLDSADPGRQAIGPFAYAGGLVLTSEATARLHGLSDLAVAAGGRLTAVSDEGDLLQARIILDGAGRLAGVTDARLSGFVGLDGKPLQGKEWSDAEGLAVLANGDRLVSFERQHRIWRYPAAGGPAQAVNMPDAAFPANDGMEALAPDPAAGPDAYVVGAEDSGETWTCRLSAPCVKGPTIDKPGEFGLVAVARLPAGRTAWLLRAYDPVRGARVTLKIVGPQGPVAQMELARPLTVDNYEGLAAVPGADGKVRFYLISDDNFSASQRTLLLAFDWTPPN